MLFLKLFNCLSYIFDCHSKLIDRRTLRNPRNDDTTHIQKISHKTLCENFENGGLKHVDISSKITSLQCSWLQKPCDENFHEWEKIPSHLINKYFGKSLKFHLCFSFDCKLFIKFSEFYRNIFFQWSRSLFVSSELPCFILSNVLWFNKHIFIEKILFFSLFLW